jgi:hypothetical protein
MSVFKNISSTSTFVIMIAVVTMIVGGIYMTSKNSPTRDRPSQINMYLVFNESSSNVIDGIAKGLATKFSLLAAHDVLNHGGPKGNLHVYSISNSSVMVKVQSSINDGCGESMDDKLIADGYPQFSDQVFFVSIFKTSRWGRTKPTPDEIADALKSDVIQKGGRISSELDVCNV